LDTRRCLAGPRSWSGADRDGPCLPQLFHLGPFSTSRLNGNHATETTACRLTNRGRYDRLPRVVPADVLFQTYSSAVNFVAAQLPALWSVIGPDRRPPPARRGLPCPWPPLARQRRAAHHLAPPEVVTRRTPRRESAQPRAVFSPLSLHSPWPRPLFPDLGRPLSTLLNLSRKNLRPADRRIPFGARSGPSPEAVISPGSPQSVTHARVAAPADLPRPRWQVSNLVRCPADGPGCGCTGKPSSRPAPPGPTTCSVPRTHGDHPGNRQLAGSLRAARASMGPFSFPSPGVTDAPAHVRVLRNLLLHPRQHSRPRFSRPPPCRQSPSRNPQPPRPATGRRAL